MLKKKWECMKKLLFTVGFGCAMAGVSFPVTGLAAGKDAYVAEESVVMDEADADVLSADVVVITSGTTKGNCKWSIDSNYALKITGGSGAVLYGNDKTNWEKYKTKISSITIDVPVAKDLEYMFEGYGAVKTIKATIAKTEGTLNFTFACKSKELGSALTTADLSGMNVSDVTSIYGMFYECTNLTTVKVANWDTSNICNMTFAFSFCENLKSIDVSKWNTSNVTSMGAMFQHCEKLENLDVSKWDTSKVKYGDFLFSKCLKLKKLDVSKWNTSNMTTMQCMFQCCSSLTGLNVSNFNTSRTENMAKLFYGCSSLKKLDVGKFDTGNVQDMSRMFGKCSELTSLNLSKFNTSDVTQMDGMFYECTNLTKLDLSSFNTSKVQNAQEMFMGCKKLKTLNLSSFQLGKIVDYDYVKDFLNGCTSLEILKAPKQVNVKIPLSKDRSDGRVWYRDDKNTMVTELPKKTKVSVTLHLQEKGNKIVDVRTSGWEYESVKYVTDKKLMNGVGNTSDKNKYIIFKGNDALTRAQFVQVLFNKESPKVNTKLSNPFKDVKKTDYFYNAVLWANNKKIVSGTSTKAFSPNDKIRRQDLVTILFNYASDKGQKYVSITKNYTINSFKDYKKVDNYAVKAITWATCHKIMSGKPISGTKQYNLDPKGTASRAECAAILKNFESYMSSVK